MYGPRTNFNQAGWPAFSVDLPPGLVFCPLSEVEPAPKPFTFAKLFASIIAINGPAAINFSLFTAKDTHSLTKILQRCAKERGSDNPSIFFEKFGGEQHRHPGLLGEIAAGCELGVLEDGGQVIVMEATGDPSIWSDYGPFLHQAMLSVELLAPSGPTLPLAADQAVPELELGVPDPYKVEDAARAAALEEKSKEAAVLIANGRFDAAEALINPGAGPGVSARTARLYEERLRDSGGADKNTREMLYRRALHWTLRSYPEPHTEVEAENYSRGLAEDRARLIQLLGYDPGQS